MINIQKNFQINNKNAKNNNSDIYIFMKQVPVTKHKYELPTTELYGLIESKKTINEHRMKVTHQLRQWV